MIITLSKVEFDPVKFCLTIAQDYRADVQFSKDNPDDCCALPAILHDQMLAAAQELEKLDKLIHTPEVQKLVQK